MVEIMKEDKTQAWAVPVVKSRLHDSSMDSASSEVGFITQAMGSRE